jgi:hypothetical protein
MCRLQILLLNILMISLLCPKISFSQNDILKINLANGEIRTIPVIELDRIEFSLSTPVENSIISNNDNIIKLYPNPSETYINIKFFVENNGKAIITIFDILGNKIKTFNLTNCIRGENTVLWNGKNASGEDMPSGIYRVVIRTSKKILSKQFQIIK